MRRFLGLFYRSPEFPHLSADPRMPWFSLLNNPLPLPNYLELIDRHYSNEPGLILGPDDWYVSRLEAYKYESSVQHELLCVTAKRTPRLPHEDYKNNSLMEACFIVDRRVEHNRPTRGGSRNTETLGDDLDIEDESRGWSSSVGSSSSGSSGITPMVEWVYGQKVAWDTAQLVRCKMKALKDCIKLGHMDFPTPPHLPAEDDFRGTLEALENPSVEPLTEAPRFVSLPTLISLASYISQKYPKYSPTDKNCYWYCATVIHILRKHARVDFTLATKANIDISYEEDRASIKEKIKTAKTIMGRCFFFTVTGIPEDESIAQEAQEWKLEDEKRVQELRAVRRAKLTKMKEVEDRADRADNERERADNEKKRADEEKKRADEEKKRADDLQRELDALRARRSRVSRYTKRYDVQ